MTKEEILNGMSEEEFYRLYPTREDWENSQQMKLGGLSGAPHNGQPTADQFFSYGSHANDKLNIPMSNPFYLADGGTYYGGPIRPYAYGGLHMAQSGYNLTPEEAEYLKNYPLSEGQQYDVGDDTHNLHFTIGPNNTITSLQKRNPKWKVEKTAKYTDLPLEGENYDFAKKYLENDIKNIYQQSLVDKLNRNVTSYTPSDDFKQYINTLNERKKKGETLDGYDDIYHYMTDNTQGKPLSKHMIENYGGYHPAALAKYLQKEYFVDKKYGGYMDMGGNMTSPTNYGAFNVPMEYGGYEEYGGVLDPSNNQDYPMLETGGRSTLQNIIKAASKKLKKEYGGDTVMQGGNSDNYPQNITNNFKNAIKRNMYNSMINEEEKAASEAVMQMGGYPGGMYYNQGSQLNPQNQMLQSMYQQRIDDTQANLRNDFSNLMGATQYLQDTANPYTQTTVKAKDGLDLSKYTDDEIKAFEEYFGKKARGNNYYYGPGQGMNYFPMNYNPYGKISKKDVALMQQLAANPTTNLKEFSHRHFGPWGRTKMTFGYKDQTPFTEYKGDPIQVDLKNNPNITSSTLSQGTLPSSFVLRPGVAVDNIYTPERQILNLPYSPLKQGPTQGVQTKEEATKGKAPFWVPTHSPIPMTDAYAPGYSYGGLFKAQYGRDHKSTNPADGLYDMNGNPVGTNSPTGNLGVSANPIAMPQPSFQPTGNAPGAAPMAYEGPKTTPAFSTPESVGLQQKNTEMKGMGSGEKQATITTKQRPGFSGEAIANWTIAGINTLASGLEQRENAKNRKKLAEMQLADNAFVSTPGSALSQGDYDPNSGMFRPNQMVPVQFPGYSGYNQYTGFGAYGGSFQDGGMYEEGQELDLSPEEIEELRAQGYDIEYLD